MVGALVARRAEVRPFSAAQIKLFETFADQAVIAIENVRLFHELDEKTREQAETLDEQAATNHILEIISQSPTDVQPVLDAIVESAAQVGGADAVTIRFLEDDALRAAARFGPHGSPDIIPFDHGTYNAVAILERRTIRLEDATKEAGPGTEFPDNTFGEEHPGAVSIPLAREADVIGVMSARVAGRPFTDRQVALLETFAAQAVIAIENVRLFHELEERNAALREALEHQTATSEVLGILSRSPTDAQPVLDAICEGAARVCGVDDVLLRILDDEAMVIRAHFGPLQPGGLRVPLSQEPWVRLAERGTRHIPDLENPEMEDAEFAERVRNQFPVPGRTRLWVPLRRQGQLAGALSLRRVEVQPFTEAQIKLLETFADQAVIALENVRLFHQLEEKTREQAETLEEQAATNHILEIISQSPTDVQPVLDAIAEAAARVCGAHDALVMLRHDDGRLHPDAHIGSLPLPEPLSEASNEMTRIIFGEGPPASLHVRDL